MKITLDIADDLHIGTDAVTQTFGVLAVRGAGKSNLAAVMAEQMHGAALPFVVVDPVGSWWGLRSTRDGGGAGLPVPIFGGRHGDMPLERAAGGELAAFIVEKRLSCVLDVSEFSEGDKTRFLIDFAERLYRANEQPLHLFLEEADDYIPQKPFREQARLLRAWENIVRRGRARGLGMTMITQRSAAINKSVLTQIETLFVLRTTSPNDRKAVQGWIDYHGESREVLATLPSLATGEAWVWSPNWLQTFRRVQVHQRATFDSAATPKQAKKAAPPATLADVNLAELSARFSESIEKAKADDPKALRAEIAALKRQLAAAEKATPAPADVVKVPVLEGEELKRAEALIAEIRAADERFKAALLPAVDELRGFATAFGEAVHAALDPLTAAIAKATALPLPSRAGAPSAAHPRRGAATPASPVSRAATSNGHAPPLGRCERALLGVLAQFPEGRTRTQLAILSGYSGKSSSFANAIGGLRSAGYAAGSDPIRITDTGAALAGEIDRPPDGVALFQHWSASLGKAERAILEALRNAGQPLTKEEISDRTGYSVTSSSFANALGKLRTLGLAHGPGSGVEIAPELAE